MVVFWGLFGRATGITIATAGIIVLGMVASTIGGIGPELSHPGRRIFDGDVGLAVSGTIEGTIGGLGAGVIAGIILELTGGITGAIGLSIATGVAYAITMALNGKSFLFIFGLISGLGLVTGMVYMATRLIGEKYLVGIFFGFIWGVGVGLASGINGGVIKGISSGFFFGLTVVIAYLRLYYHPFHFLLLNLQGHRERYHLRSFIPVTGLVSIKLPLYQGMM